MRKKCMGLHAPAPTFSNEFVSNTEAQALLRADEPGVRAS